MKVLIVVPAYNEAENLETVIDNLNNIKDSNHSFDYIIVNDGSTDDTSSVCKDNNYQFIDLPVNLGLAGAFQTGVKYAKEKGYEAVIQFDGDGQHQASYLLDLVDEMEKNNADIVIGSRFLNEKKPWNARMLGSRLLSLIIYITSGKHLSDPTSGMRLYRSNVFYKFANEINYTPEPDTICYLIRNGAKVVEVQVVMKDRMHGKSYLNLAKSFKYMTEMIISILFIQFFRK